VSVTSAWHRAAGLLIRKLINGVPDFGRRDPRLSRAYSLKCRRSFDAMRPSRTHMTNTSHQVVLSIFGFSGGPSCGCILVHPPLNEP
jgi:hypothetical protein